MIFSPSGSSTGKRECPESMATDRMCCGGSSPRTQIIWLCGTMMSRTCRSDTSSTPSTMDSASASSRPALRGVAQHLAQLRAVLRAP